MTLLLAFKYFNCSNSNCAMKSYRIIKKLQVKKLPFGAHLIELQGSIYKNFKIEKYNLSPLPFSV